MRRQNRGMNRTGQQGRKGTQKETRGREGEIDVGESESGTGVLCS